MRQSMREKLGVETEGTDSNDSKSGLEKGARTTDCSHRALLPGGICGCHNKLTFPKMKENPC